MNVIAHLRERGFVDAVTSEDLEEVFNKPQKVYVGFDPTADSLTVGNLMGVMALAHLQRAGHTPVVVLGGTTGRIGDPSGKDAERPLLSEETIRYNMGSIREHFEQILDFSDSLPTPVVLNNDEWYHDFRLIDFLREVGKHFRIGSMLAKDSVRTRIDSEEGMSFTEFSYQLIQGYDFHFLNKEYGVTAQMGGSDQWGNITAGIELNRKLSGNQIYGLTWPLLVRSDGKKFGKSEGGAVWLSAKKTSPYQFYQYFYRVPDADVIMMMKRLTFMELSKIAKIEEEMRSASYVPNSAQKRLAEEITKIVHGSEGLEKALKVTKGAAPGKKADLDAETLAEIAADMPHVSLSEDKVVGQKYADLAVEAGLLPSKGEANRMIKNGGAYLNNEKVSDPSFEVSSELLVEGKFLLIGAGKKKKALITVQ